MAEVRGLVVLPAHDEEQLVPRALEAVVVAARRAVGAGALHRVDVVVAAHRCRDRTAEIAAEALADLPVGEGLVLADETSRQVGEVRDRAVRAAVDALAPDPARTWLLSTDADSVVPPTWCLDLLAAATDERAVAVAGLTRLVDWHASPQARAEYARIIRAGLVGERHHTHVYAANLAVRLDAYLAVGGFPAPEHGEEAGLLAALSAAGHPVTSTREGVVETSGRMPGRAALGLGALLDRIEVAHAEPELGDAEAIGL